MVATAAVVVVVEIMVVGSVVVAGVVVVAVVSTSWYQPPMLGEIEWRGDWFGGRDSSLQHVVTLQQWKRLTGCVKECVIRCVIGDQ